MYKPLDPLDGFEPIKTCAEYVLQDCVRALPDFTKFAETLVRESKLVASSILDAGLSRNLDPTRVFALVQRVQRALAANASKLLSLH